MKIIETPNMPKSNGHYSMCIEHNGTIYTAGQIPKHAKTGEIPEGIAAQTLLVLQKVENIVNAAGSSKDRIISMRIYVSNIDLWGKVNEVYADFFGNHKPVRIVIPTRDLHYGCLIEVEAIAAL